MSRFKNATVAALTGTGVSLLFNLPLEVAGPVVAGSFVTTFILPTAFDMTVNAGVGTFNLVKDQGLPAAARGIKFLYGKTKEALYNVSPTNPEQNTLAGSSLGFAASTSIAKAAGLEEHPYYPYAVAGSTAAGGFLGFIFPNHRISSVLQKASEAFKPKTPKKLLQETTDDTGLIPTDPQTDGDVKNKSHKNK